MMLATLLATAAVATTLVSASPIIVRRQDAICSSGVHVIHARGSTESEAEDKTLPIVDRLLAEIPDSSESDVDYPAILISEEGIYTTSVAEGVNNLEDQIEAYVDACGEDSRIVLLGFSQGANVISSAVAGGLVNFTPLNPSYRKSILAIALFGDPTHRAGQSYNAGDADGSGIFKRVFPSTTLLEQYSDELRDYCAEGDFFCDAGGSLDVHSAEVDTYGDDTADWIIGLAGQ